MDVDVSFQIILIKPTAGVDFGLQKGFGNNYETIQKQRSAAQDLCFQFPVKVKGDKQKDHSPKLSGPFVQGSAGNKFVYIDIGTYAGQTDTPCSRRLKVPLTGITWELVDKLISNQNFVLESRAQGTGKDGGPNCATVKPFDGWHLRKA